MTKARCAAFLLALDNMVKAPGSWAEKRDVLKKLDEEDNGMLDEFLGWSLEVLTLKAGAFVTLAITDGSEKEGRIRSLEEDNAVLVGRVRELEVYLEQARSHESDHDGRSKELVRLTREKQLLKTELGTAEDRCVKLRAAIESALTAWGELAIGTLPTLERPMLALRDLLSERAS